jgi:hypothetical protein
MWMFAASSDKLHRIPPAACLVVETALEAVARDRRRHDDLADRAHLVVVELTAPLARAAAAVHASHLVDGVLQRERRAAEPFVVAPLGDFQLGTDLTQAFAGNAVQRRLRMLDALDDFGERVAHVLQLFVQAHRFPFQFGVADAGQSRPKAKGRARRWSFLHVLMLPDFELADRIGEFWVYPQSRAFAELLIDCEEDRTLWAVLVGMLREMELGRREP